MDPGRAALALDRWFATHARPAPWRSTHEPYHVLVAEFILQQTRMETGLRYFAAFLRRFPTLPDLARAPESDVLQVWSGLGYYARARYLWRTARRIMADFGGRIPQDATTLRTLPGIGPYTAGAVSSIAFDRPEPALDGNQLRVLGRLLGARDPNGARGRQRSEAWVRRMLAHGSPRRLNQALMDLGSLVCAPRQPRCASCPLARGCAYARRRPRVRAPARRHEGPWEDWEALVRVRAGRVWLSSPRPDGLLAHLWLPPLRPARGRIRTPDAVHRFSHKTWRLRWVETRRRPSGAGRWVAVHELEGLPHGALTRRFVEAALASGGR